MRLQSRLAIVCVAAVLGLAVAAAPAAAQTTWTTSGTISSGTSYSRLFVGSSPSPGPTLTINSGAAISINNSAIGGVAFSVGTDAQPFGAVIQNGGSVTVDGAAGQLYLGVNNTSPNTSYTGTASYTLNSGTVVLGSTNNSTYSNLLLIGRSGGNNTFTQNGGRVTVYRTTENSHSVLAVGSVGQGTYSLTSGTFEGIGVATGSANGLSVGGGASGTLTINGAGAAMAIEQSNAVFAGGTAAGTRCM